MANGSVFGEHPDTTVLRIAHPQSPSSIVLDIAIRIGDLLAAPELGVSANSARQQESAQAKIHLPRAAIAARSKDNLSVLNDGVASDPDF